MSKPAGCKTSGGYIAVQMAGKNLMAHRVAFYLMNVVMPSHQLDHINGDRTDNRWCNLRTATNAENKQNLSKKGTGTSGYLGVSKFKNKWVSRIVSNGERIHLGTFTSPEEAHFAYVEAKKLHHTFNPTIRGE
jgi:hypothetical protein